MNNFKTQQFSTHALIYCVSANTEINISCAIVVCVSLLTPKYSCILVVKRDASELQ